MRLDVGMDWLSCDKCTFMSTHKIHFVKQQTESYVRVILWHAKNFKVAKISALVSLHRLRKLSWIDTFRKCNKPSFRKAQFTCTFMIDLSDFAVGVQKIYTFTLVSSLSSWHFEIHSLVLNSEKLKRYYRLLGECNIFQKHYQRPKKNKMSKSWCSNK